MSTDTAIVLSLQRHSDRAHILHTYTRSSGRMNFLVYGLASKRKPTAQFAPLSVIEITADIRPDRPLPTLKEASPVTQYQSLSNELKPYQTSVALFIAEILFRTLRHPMQDEALFRFLENTVTDLNQAPDIHNVHIRFLIGFAAALGFAISDEDSALLRTATTRQDRQLLLHQLCDYLTQHIDGFQTPLSLDVLSEVFD